MKPLDYEWPGDTDKTVTGIEGHNARGKKANCPGFR